MTVTVETASVRHLDLLYEIEKQCFAAEAFTKQQVAGLLYDYNSLTLVAKVTDEIIGFIIGSLDSDKDTLIGHILTIDVLPQYRQKGVGAKLLEQLESLFRDKGVSTCRLEVREDNSAALNLYRRLGYKPLGKLKNYYGAAHALQLEKSLTQLQ